ncbi:hypothetical protein RPPX_09020 [Pseudomonas putida S12]|uniref:Uncharacterized protein n=1 Tax=Pseudomonas putida S12 TaxID=1215087 RepID=A0AA34WQU3_PSEPU|nr:hypothetical protein RPPX_09020 [Pseudomonas putida S12]
MQARPVHPTAFFAQVFDCLGACFISATQVQGDMHQGVFSGNVRVNGEERFMAGIAATEGMGGGTRKRRIWNDFFHDLLQSLELPLSRYHAIWRQLYARW